MLRRVRRGRAEVRDGGVYWQARGPRLETPAEIRLIAAHADVIGMTIASECVVAGELGLRYAAVCVVDNLANGVAESELTIDELEQGRERNLRPRLRSALTVRAARRWLGCPDGARDQRGATLDGEAVALRGEDGRIAELGPDVEAAAGRRA